MHRRRFIVSVAAMSLGLSLARVVRGRPRRAQHGDAKPCSAARSLAASDGCECVAKHMENFGGLGGNFYGF